jgi:hypothetical protein
MLLNKDEYLSILKDIKSQIRKAQVAVLVNVNKEMITLYWNIENMINERSSWGDKFIENLSRDIKVEFPGTKGYGAVLVCRKNEEPIPP